MGFDFKKFLASGTKPVEQRGKGARPKGSPPATVIKGTKDKKKKVVKKSNQVSKAVEKSQKKARLQKNVEKGKTAFLSKTKKQSRKSEVKQPKIPKILANAIKGNKVDMKKIDTVEKGRVAAKAAGLKPGAGVYYDKTKKKMLASVTAKQLADSGLTLNQYLNKARGLTPRNKTTKTNLAMKSRSMTDSYKPDDTVGMKGYKTGGITKRRFGGMAKGGFKMPNKVKIT